MSPVVTTMINTTRRNRPTSIRETSFLPIKVPTAAAGSNSKAVRVSGQPISPTRARIAKAATSIAMK